MNSSNSSSLDFLYSTVGSTKGNVPFLAISSRKSLTARLRLMPIFFETSAASTFVSSFILMYILVVLCMSIV